MTTRMTIPRLRLVTAFAIVAAISIFGLFALNGPLSVSAQADTTAPTVSSVAISSDPDENDADLGAYSTGRNSQSSNWGSGVYRIGDDVRVTVAFSEDIIVTGSPQLELAIGSSNRTAAYESTEGSAVVFSYTVAEGDTDSDGIAIGADKLTLNSGSIKDSADSNANLSHNALAAQDGHKVDGIRPRISRLFLIASTGGSDGAYSEGEELIIVAEFNEDNPHGSVTGPPRIKLDFNGDEKMAPWDISLRFNAPRDYGFFGYVVQEGDLDSDGVAISANSIDLNGGFIRDPAGNDAVLTHSAVAASSSFKVDAVAPTVSSIAITSDPGDDDTYGTGDRVEVTVTFSENMSLPISISCSADVVHCEAELELDIGGTARTADYQSHAGADVVFAYTVQAEDADDNGISIDANKLTGQRITDAAGKNGEGINDADLSHDAVDDDAEHKVATALQPAKSTDAKLSALTLSGIVLEHDSNYLSPGFRTAVVSYFASVAYSLTQTTVTPTANNSGASYVVKLGGVTDTDDVVSLATGSNVITIEVTAEDGETTRTYTVTVTRAVAPSTDATLKWLALSGIDIGNGLGHNAYAQVRTSFTASVYHSVSQTTVTPTANHSAASYVIKLDGVTDGDGVIALSVGSNVITIEATSEDGQTTKTYTATVTRATASAPTTGELPADNPSVNFRVSSYSHNYVFLAFNIPRNRGITGTVTQRYEHDGDNFVSAGADGRYEHTFDDDLGGLSTAWSYTEPEPDTLYKWVVEMLNSQNTTVIETTLTVRTPQEPGVTELSSDATLSDLTLSGINFEATDRAFIAPGFHDTVVSYVGTVANSVTETTVTPMVTHSDASYVIKLGGVTDSDGTISLALGSNVITVEVTAEDGETTRTYTVTITRVSTDASRDATLSGLTMSRINFGTFASGTTSYSAQVANTVTETTVTPTVNHSEASYVIKLGGVTDADGMIALSAGSNVITVEVTAEDTTTTKTYTVNVIRAAPPSTDATLSALTLSGIDFGIFGSGTSSYSAQVANSVSQTTVTPIVNHSEASYVIKLDGVDDDGVISLAVGSNVITVEVTAEDESTTKTYTVTVTRAAPPSTEATLSALTLSGIDFGIFDSTTISYSAPVANSVSQTTVTPTAKHSGASYIIELGGVTDPDGVIPLSVGSNAITVSVTAEDGTTTRIYTVIVIREGSPVPESMMDRYDANNDDLIDRDEVFAAIEDYLFNDAITKGEVIEVISLYLFAPTPSQPAPGAPTVLTAAANGQTMIDLSWRAPSDDGGASITGYRIEA